MILSKREVFSEAQSVVSAPGNVLSTNVIEVDGTTPDDELYIDIIVDTAATSATSAATVAVQVITDDVSGMTSPATVLAATGAVIVTAITAGAKPFSAIRVPRTKLKKYIALRYVVAVEATTAGELSAALVLRPQTNQI